MAWLRPLGSCQECKRPAEVELLDIRNASHGKFCQKHGEAARARLDAIERTAMRP